MDVKKISSNDIYCLLSSNYDAVYQLIARSLDGTGQMIFAKRHVGQGYFIWRHPEEGWTPLPYADDIEKTEAMEAMSRARGVILERFAGNKNLSGIIDDLLCVPSDDFIFYKYDSLGRCQVLLTAWGYRFPARQTTGPMSTSLPKDDKYPVYVSFVRKGEPVPHSAFYLSLKTTRKRLVTGADGRCSLGTIAPGRSFDIRHMDTGAEYTLTIIAGQEEYQFNLPYEEPAPEEEQPEMPQPFPPVEEDEIPSPVEPMPSEPEPSKPDVEPVADNQEIGVVSPVIKVIGEDDQIMPYYPLVISYSDVSTRKLTDSEGLVRLPEMEAGQEMTVVDEFNPAVTENYTIDADREVYVFRTPYTKVSTLNDITVSVMDADGTPFTPGSVLFIQNSKELLVQLDEDGRCHIGSDYFETDAPMNALLAVNGREFEPIDFKLEKGQKEYVLQVRNKAGNLKTLLINVLVVLLAILILSLILDAFLKIMGYSTLFFF